MAPRSTDQGEGPPAEQAQRKRSPAFQFYPDQFMGGKPALMEPLETHVYIWLLCLDWNQGGFVEDEKALARWCRVSVPTFRKAWPAVRECFELRGDRLFNPRLEKERERQAEWREKSSRGGKKSAEQRKGASTTLEPKVQPKGNTPVSYSPNPVTTTTKTTTRSRKKREPVEGNWVSRLAAFFREKGGQVSEGHLGAALKSAHEKFGEATVRTAMGLWLAERKTHGWSCKFAKFAEDHVRWCEQAVLLEQALASGVDYWDNEALQQLTRPSLVA